MVGLQSGFWIVNQTIEKIISGRRDQLRTTPKGHQKSKIRSHDETTIFLQKNTTSLKNLQANWRNYANCKWSWKKLKPDEWAGFFLNRISQVPLALLSDLASLSVFFDWSANFSPCKIWRWNLSLKFFLDIKQHFCNAMRSLETQSWLLLHKTWCQQAVLVSHREESSDASFLSAIEADCPAPRVHA